MKFNSSFYKQVLALTLVLIVPANLAQASENIPPPSYGTLIGRNDGDVIDYKCGSLQNGNIRCSFVQVLLRNQYNQDSFQSALDSIPEFLEEIKSGSETCALLLARQDLLQGKQVSDPSLRNDAQQMIDNLNNEKATSAVEAWEADEERLNAFTELCRQPSQETVANMIKVNTDLDRQTCSPTVNRFEQVFTQVDENLWVVLSEPVGECGVVNTSRFIWDESSPFIWNYQSSKVVTNKQGKGLIPCSELDEEPQPYRWDQSPVHKNCVFLK